MDNSVRADLFFDSVWGQSSVEGICIAVSHVLGSSKPFLGNLGKRFSHKILIPKQKSKDDVIVGELTVTGGWGRLDLEDKDFKQGTFADLAENSYGDTDFKTMLANAKTVWIFDVGGKFALENGASIEEFLRQELNVYVIEDTENGFRKYMALKKANRSLFSNPRFKFRSVARSTVKEPEDYWTGRGIVEATETIIRTKFGVLADEHAIVFGYGKIGRSIAHALREKRLHTYVVEKLDSRAVLAKCHGFQILTEIEAQKKGGFVFLATGSAKKKYGLNLRKLLRFKSDAIFTTVTSYDDEIAGFDPNVHLEVLANRTSKQSFTSGLRDVVAPHILVKEALEPTLRKLKGANAGVSLQVVNNGNPPNFLFQASCGPYIFLVQAGLISHVCALTKGDLNDDSPELTLKQEEEIFTKWRYHF